MTHRGYILIDATISLLTLAIAVSIMSVVAHHVVLSISTSSTLDQDISTAEASLHALSSNGTGNITSHTATVANRHLIRYTLE